MNLLRRILRKLAYLTRRFVLRDVQLNALASWYKVNPTSALLYQHNLPPQPVIWDVGGFTGEWAAGILATYPHARLHVFEPLPEYAALLRKRFASHRNVTIHPYGLGDADAQVPFYLGGEGSSTIRTSGTQVTVPVRDVREVWAELQTQTIHLLALNAEGAEYAILPALHAARKLAHVHTLLLQFHNLTSTSRRQHHAIQRQLAHTHHLVFNFPFVWEKWVNKKS